MCIGGEYEKNLELFEIELDKLIGYLKIFIAFCVMGFVFALLKDLLCI